MEKRVGRGRFGEDRTNDYRQGFDDALDVALELNEKHHGLALRRELERMRRLRREDRVERILGEF